MHSLNKNTLDAIRTRTLLKSCPNGQVFNRGYLKDNSGRIAQGKAIKKRACTLLIKIPWMRFERMTYCLEGSCSIQLSYQGKPIYIFTIHKKCMQVLLKSDCYQSPTDYNLENSYHYKSYDWRQIKHAYWR